MGIDTSGIEKLLSNVDGMMDVAIDTVREALKIACINTVGVARMSGTYTDRTGNLRSSIGYMIKDNGKTVAEDFQSAGAGSTDGSEGTRKAREVAERVSSMYGNQLVAVLVAGEDYAVYVESLGFDVISGSMLNFAKRFNEYFVQAGGNAMAIRVKKGVGNK